MSMSEGQPYSSDGLIEWFVGIFHEFNSQALKLSPHANISIVFVSCKPFDLLGNYLCCD